jgi:hypothetical protein
MKIFEIGVAKTGTTSLGLAYEILGFKHKMIWISLNDAKKLFIMENNQPIYLQGSSCWFDSQKSHGTKSNGYSISMRIDGKFKSDFRNKIFGDGSEWQTIKKW